MIYIDKRWGKIRYILQFDQIEYRPQDMAHLNQHKIKGKYEILWMADDVKRVSRTMFEKDIYKDRRDIKRLLRKIFESDWKF